MLALVALLAACTSSARRAVAWDEGPAYLHVWATAFDTATPATAQDRRRRRGVFLATVDLRRGSPTFGRVVGAVADTAGRNTHHTEHELGADGLLFANDFGAGRTYRLDLSAPASPRILGTFTTAGPLADPHSFVRLPGGTLLATFQNGAGGRPPGGLAELRRDGTMIRWSSAASTHAVDSTLVPYSLEVIPSLDRVVSTSTSMRADVGVHVQVWRLSDLALLHTLPLPVAPPHDVHESHDAKPGDDDVHHLWPGEPRLLADGRTVLLGTFTCGVYRLSDLASTSPRLEFAHALPGRDCAVPVRVGRWWVQTVPSLRALVTMDVSDPRQPREVSRLTMRAPALPHWIAADGSGRWVVLTSGSSGDPRAYLVRLDPASGRLEADATLPSIDLSAVHVPGLGVVRAVPHGAVFSSSNTRSTTSASGRRRSDSRGP